MALKRSLWPPCTLEAFIQKLRQLDNKHGSSRRILHAILLGGLDRGDGKDKKKWAKQPLRQEEDLVHFTVVDLFVLNAKAAVPPVGLNGRHFMRW